MRYLVILIACLIFCGGCVHPRNIRWLEEYPAASNGTEFLKTIVLRTVRIEAISVTNGNTVLSHNGAGAVISSDGLVLTANHVLGERFTNLYVYRCGLNVERSAISCGARENARLIRRDPIHDLALIKIANARSLPRFRLGNMEGLERGDLLWRAGMDEIGWAVGPLLSPYSESVRGRMEILFPARGGASGGPVVDEEGRLVGIVTSAPLGAVAISMVAYAVSIDTARAIIPINVNRR